MDLSFRLDHVPRLTEHLTFIDRGHMTRSVSIDVDLNVMSQAQRQRLAVSDPHGGQAMSSVGGPS